MKVKDCARVHSLHRLQAHMSLNGYKSSIHIRTNEIFITCIEHVHDKNQLTISLSTVQSLHTCIHLSYVIYTYLVQSLDLWGQPTMYTEDLLINNLYRKQGNMKLNCSFYMHLLHVYQ